MNIFFWKNPKPNVPSPGSPTVPEAGKLVFPDLVRLASIAMPTDEVVVHPGRFSITSSYTFGDLAREALEVITSMVLKSLIIEDCCTAGIIALSNGGKLERLKGKTEPWAVISN